MSVAVSVIICTWNRAGLLDQTLTRMRDLCAPAGLAWELLVVNNNCTDDTDGVIAAHQKGPLPIRRLLQPRPGKCHAANLALAEAAGELHLWTDDDVLVDPRWLESVVDGAEAFPHAVGFGGPIDPWFPVEPDPVLVDVFPPLRMGFCGLDLGPDAREMTAAEQAFGANMAFRASAVRRLRFDPNLGRVGNLLGGHEEKDFQDRLRAIGGGPVVWLPGMRVRHYVDPERMTPAYMGKYYYGIGVTDTRRGGVLAGPTLLGAPRYLYRLCAAEYARYLRSWLRGNRKSALEHLRSYHYHRGVIRGCRDLSRSSAVPVGGGS